MSDNSLSVLCELINSIFKDTFQENFLSEHPKLVFHGVTYKTYPPNTVLISESTAVDKIYLTINRKLIITETNFKNLEKRVII